MPKVAESGPAFRCFQSTPSKQPLPSTAPYMLPVRSTSHS